MISVMIVRIVRIVAAMIVPVFVPALAGGQEGGLPGRPAAPRPDILLVIAEDASWRHFGAYGHIGARTPAFDRVASEGVLFTHAFANEPTCSPSRAAILTGQDFWRLENASVFGGTLKRKFPVYPGLLESAGYRTGTNGKVWGPGSWKDGGWPENPGGRSFPSFQDFLASVPGGRPFCFWQGSPDAHRPYSRELTLRSGRKADEVEVPPFLPDRVEVRMDILDYYCEIERFDRLVARLLDLLEKAGRADNTIVVVTSDHGMPFARGKAHLYDLGTRVPLAVRWPARIPAGRTIDDFVGLTDLAPTFLAAAGLSPDPAMTGKSFLDLLLSSREGRLDPARSRAIFGKEIGIGCVYDSRRLAGNPSRAIRTARHLYIQNHDVDRMPGYNAVQGGPGTEILEKEKNRDPEMARRYELSYGTRPEEELYDCTRDPFQMKNLARLPEYVETRQKLRRELEQYLEKSGDPRRLGRSEVFLTYPIFFRRGRKAGESVFLKREPDGRMVLEER